MEFQIFVEWGQVEGNMRFVRPEDQLVPQGRSLLMAIWSKVPIKNVARDQVNKSFVITNFPFSVGGSMMFSNVNPRSHLDYNIFLHT